MILQSIVNEEPTDSTYRLHGSFIVRKQKLCIKHGRKIMQLTCYPAGCPGETIKVNFVQRTHKTPGTIPARLRFVRPPYSTYRVGFTTQDTTYTLFTLHQDLFQTQHVGRSFMIETTPQPITTPETVKQSFETFTDAMNPITKKSTRP